MNRIQPVAKSHRSQNPLTQSQFTVAKKEADYCHAAIAPPCFSFLSPLHYEPKYAYPLIVWLHGPDDNENQLKKVLPLVSMRNYAAVAARGTTEAGHESHLPRCNWQQSDDHIAAAEQRIFEAVSAATQKFNIAAERIFIAGLECGGTMALRLAMRNPERFAGALSFGGPFPTDRAPLSRLASVRRLPLFLATTQDSTLYPQEMVCEQLRLFHSAGMVVTLRQYPGEDGLTTLMLSDMDRWIMEQINQPADSSVDEAITGRTVR